MSQSLRETWEAVPNDPDPEADLGYESVPLTLIDVQEGEEKYVLLPREEDHLTDSEFIIAGTDSVQSLSDRR